MATMKCKVCGAENCVSDECSVCYIDSMITYASSRKQVINELNMLILEEQRRIFEELHPDLFTTKT
jgi:hypothetical protein